MHILTFSISLISSSFEDIKFAAEALKKMEGRNEMELLVKLLEKLIGNYDLLSPSFSHPFKGEERYFFNEAIEEIGRTICYYSEFGYLDDELKTFFLEKLKSNPTFIWKNISIWILGSSKDSKLTEIIIPFLKFKHESIQRSAIHNLGLLGDNNAVDSLIALYEEIKEFHIKLDIIETLGKIADSKAVPFLEQVLMKEKSATLKVEAAEALYLIGNEESLNILIEAQKELLDPLVRSTLNRILSNLDDKLGG